MCRCALARFPRQQDRRQLCRWRRRKQMLEAHRTHQVPWAVPVSCVASSAWKRCLHPLQVSFALGLSARSPRLFHFLMRHCQVCWQPDAMHCHHSLCLLMQAALAPMKSAGRDRKPLRVFAAAPMVTSAKPRLPGQMQHRNAVLAKPVALSSSRAIMASARASCPTAMVFA
jgi:hypothetical protein